MKNIAAAAQKCYSEFDKEPTPSASAPKPKTNTFGKITEEHKLDLKKWEQDEIARVDKNKADSEAFIADKPAREARSNAYYAKMIACQDNIAAAQSAYKAAHKKQAAAYKRFDFNKAYARMEKLKAEIEAPQPTGMRNAFSPTGERRDPEKIEFNKQRAALIEQLNPLKAEFEANTAAYQELEQDTQAALAAYDAAIQAENDLCAKGKDGAEQLCKDCPQEPIKLPTFDIAPPELRQLAAPAVKAYNEIEKIPKDTASEAYPGKRPYLRNSEAEKEAIKTWEQREEARKKKDAAAKHAQAARDSAYYDEVIKREANFEAKNLAYEAAYEEQLEAHAALTPAYKELEKLKSNIDALPGRMSNDLKFNKEKARQTAEFHPKNAKFEADMAARKYMGLRERTDAAHTEMSQAKEHAEALSKMSKEDIEAQLQKALSKMSKEDIEAQLQKSKLPTKQISAPTLSSFKRTEFSQIKAYPSKAGWLATKEEKDEKIKWIKEKAKHDEKQDQIDAAYQIAYKTKKDAFDALPNFEELEKLKQSIDEDSKYGKGFLEDEVDFKKELAKKRATFIEKNERRAKNAKNYWKVYEDADLEVKNLINPPQAPQVEPAPILFITEPAPTPINLNKEPQPPAPQPPAPQPPTPQPKVDPTKKPDPLKKPVPPPQPKTDFSCTCFVLVHFLYAAVLIFATVATYLFCRSTGKCKGNKCSEGADHSETECGSESEHDTDDEQQQHRDCEMGSDDEEDEEEKSMLGNSKTKSETSAASRS
jgi:hypothetical protein